MEEINQTSPVSLSDRPTLFITMLNATEEELYQLQKAFENTDIQKNYRPIVSNKVIQAMGEWELSQLAREANVALNDEIEVERVRNTRMSLAHMERAINGLIDAVSMANENIATITSHINNQHNEYLHERVSGGMEKAKTAMHNIKEYTPKEGMKW